MLLSKLRLKNKTNKDMREVHETPNYRQFKVKGLPPTNTLGRRVQITETRRYNDQKTRFVTLPYDYEIGDIQEHALRYLRDRGFNIVARASELDHYLLLADNWGENYLDL
jgi:hypothetical protein